MAYTPFTRSSNVQQISNKRQAISTCSLFWIHLLNVCGTFAGSCKHGIMSTALQLQFFIVQAVNYSATIVKIKCNNPQYHK